MDCKNKDINVKSKNNIAWNYNIDLIKGICIILVIITHYMWTDAERLNFLFPFWVVMAVPLFMTSSGYVGALAFEKRYNGKFGSILNKGYVKRKIFRYSIPFWIIYILEQILFLFIKNEYTLYDKVLQLFTGGIGPGSYYYPLMIQFIFIMPLIYILIKKYDIHGVLICGCANVLYEVTKSLLLMNSGCYRLILLRYLLIISLGCYISIGKRKITIEKLIALGLIGAVYIYLTAYKQISIMCFQYWTGTDMIAGLLAVCYFGLMLRLQFRCKIIEKIGQASYNIFFVQMVFWMGTDYIYSLLKLNTRIMQLIISLLICLIFGIGYFKTENFIIDKFVKNSLLKQKKN